MASRQTHEQAVNQMLAAVGIRQVSSVSSETGTDDASDALRCLLRTSTDVQARGWPSNTTYGKEYTAHASTGVVDLTVGATIDILRVSCVAPGEFAGRLTVRGDNAYNSWTGTTNLGNSQKVYCDIVEELDFETECPADLQGIIIAEAIANFKAEREGGTAFAQRIAERQAKSEVTVGRNMTGPRTLSHNNDRPLVMSGSPTQ